MLLLGFTLLVIIRVFLFGFMLLSFLLVLSVVVWFGVGWDERKSKMRFMELFSVFNRKPKNELAGKPLHYLIGAEASLFRGSKDEITVVPYDARKAVEGISISYCNLFDEYNTGQYAPYLRSSDTARKYNEGQIDPKGRGWFDNLNIQFRKKKNLGFKYIELDNADAYSIDDVIGAIDLAGTYDLKVIAKNPALSDNPVKFLKHQNVFGVIIERGASTPLINDKLRREAGKPDLPMWFVFYGAEDDEVDETWHQASGLKGIGVSISKRGEYTDSTILLESR